MSLVTWIGSVIILIEHLKLYMDDSFSFELEGNVLLYKPYGTHTVFRNSISVFSVACLVRSLREQSSSLRLLLSAVLFTP